jgi:uncharacterized surface anchored protein
MKAFRRLTLLLPVAMMFATYFQPVNAQTFDKNTKITFSGPVQVPGKVLAGGTYYFKLLDSLSDRHIVRIFKDDQRTLVTTVLAIPNYRLQPKGKTVLTFSEHAPNEPEALSAWFYPGDNFGQQFLYPKSKAEELSRLNNEKVPSTESEEAYPADTKVKETATEATGDSSTLVAENTEPQQPPSAQPQYNSTTSTPAPATTDSSTTNQATKNQQLPATGSFAPLVLLVGCILLTAAAVLRKSVRV